MTRIKPLLGGIELGGTKCIILIGTGPNDIRMQVSVPTGADPDATLHRITHVLRQGIAAHGAIDALGVASFGPLDLSRQSASFGSITRTTKPGWKDTALVTRLASAFDLPIGIDTDVNGAALAEARWGAALTLSDFAYVTVGTGVGVGLVVGGRLACGFTHTELGHIRIARRPGDTFAGACVFHGDCVEGLASGSAIAARVGQSADSVHAAHPVWEYVAHDLSQLLHILVLASAPRRILIGGGVPQARPGLLPRVRELLVESLNGYVDLSRWVGGMETYVVPPGLGSLAGPLGALALAADAR